MLKLNFFFLVSKENNIAKPKSTRQKRLNPYRRKKLWLQKQYFETLKAPEPFVPETYTTEREPLDARLFRLSNGCKDCTEELFCHICGQLWWNKNSSKFKIPKKKPSKTLEEYKFMLKKFFNK